MMCLARHMVRRFGGDRSGATAVEFAILLPIMLVTFGAIIEGARIYWNYQGAVSGVRDAARYLARTRSLDECDGRGIVATLPGHDLENATAAARERIDANMRKGGEFNLFPLGVSVPTLETRLFCLDTPGFVADVTPVVVVRANVVIDLPFGTVFEMFGQRNNAVLDTWVTDQSRIYGT